jgi:hypothetical protein
VVPDDSFEADVAALLGAGRVSYRAVGPKRQTSRNGGRPWRKN